MATRETERPLPDRHARRQVHRCISQGGRQGRAEVHAEEDLKIISSPVDFVGINVYRPIAYVLASDQAPGYREIPFDQGTPEDVLGVAHARARGAVLGPEACAVALEREGDSHHRERLRGGRCAGSGRECI